ncbi:hypothetical protein B5807_05274 [Epicoccum nigrum]|uniref:Uncharacterized protein n=1 Tax=Epicoccum nigrum TaxID=105696 RepID=A0A1Y2M1Z5_EPING|nr:hypothetical protein B5807_05274 [Epicoccum nigrum]
MPRGRYSSGRKSRGCSAAWTGWETGALAGSQSSKVIRRMDAGGSYGQGLLPPQAVLHMLGLGVWGIVGEVVGWRGEGEGAHALLVRI